MKHAMLTPPPIVTVGVLTSASQMLGRRQSRSLKRSLSLRGLRTTTTSSALSPSTAASSTPSTPVAGTSSDTSLFASARALPDPSPAVAASLVALKFADNADETAANSAASATCCKSLPTSPLASNERGFARKSGGGGDSERELLVFMPLAIAYLEQVKLEFSITKQHATDVRYVLTVHHAKLNATWRHARPFREYRKLQQRLLKLLQLGHFCSAECPWMFTFLKSYFPKKHQRLFTFATAERVITARTATLERLFATTQTFLLNRANHGCGFLTTAFANELVDFIYGDMIKQYPLEQLSNAQETSMLYGSGMNSSSSSGGGARGIESSGASSNSNSASGSMATGLGWSAAMRPRRGDGSAASSADGDDASSCGSSSSCTANEGVCQLCASSLYGEAFADKNGAVTATTAATDESRKDDDHNAVLPSPSETLRTLELDLIVTSLAASSVETVPPTVVSPMHAVASSNRKHNDLGDRRRRVTHYVTTLECGHQFHDECIVPKLNETLRCPTCGHLEIK